MRIYSEWQPEYRMLQGYSFGFMALFCMALFFRLNEVRFTVDYLLNTGILVFFWFVLVNMYMFGRQRFIRRASAIVNATEPTPVQVRLEQRGAKAVFYLRDGTSVVMDEPQDRVRNLIFKDQFVDALLFKDPSTTEAVAIETADNGMCRLKPTLALRRCVFTLPWQPDETFGPETNEPLRRRISNQSIGEGNLRVGAQASDATTASATVSVFWDHIKPMIIVPAVIAATFVVIIGGVLIFGMLAHHDLMPAERINQYAKPHSSASISLKALNNTTASIETSWANGILQYHLVLTDDSGTLKQFVKQYTNGCFIVSWQSGNQSLGAVKIPFRDLQGSGKFLQYTGNVECKQKQYDDIYDNHFDWELSWEAAEAKPGAK